MKKVFLVMIVVSCLMVVVCAKKKKKVTAKSVNKDLKKLQQVVDDLKDEWYEKMAVLNSTLYEKVSDQDLKLRQQEERMTQQEVVMVQQEERMMQQEEVIVQQDRKLVQLQKQISELLQNLNCIGSSQDRISTFGNDIKASTSGVDVEGFTTLLDNPVVSPGVVFAYSAYIRHTNPVTLQHWRPRPDISDHTFQYLAGTTFTPTATGRQDVYLKDLVNGTCVSVQSGDRLGFFQPYSPGPISYTFQSTNPTAYVCQPCEYTVGDTVEFQALVFPYDFSLKGFVDTGSDPFECDNNCPTLLRIPEN